MAHDLNIPAYKGPVEAWAAELKRSIESYLQQIKPVQFTTTAELRPPTMDWLVMGLSDTGKMLYSHGGVWHTLGTGTGEGEVEDGDKGDITVSAGVWTIDPDTVTNAKLADMPAGTIKGNNTGAPGNPLDLTALQVVTMLPTFGDAAKGVVPASGGGVVNFLRADGTWASPGASAPDAPIDAEYFLLTSDPDLTNARRLLFGVGLQEVDGGGGGNYLVNFNPWEIGDTKSALVDMDILPIGDSSDTTKARFVTFADLKVSLPVFTDAVKGLVPASGGGTSNFLRADGTFAVPPGSGGVSDGDKGDIVITSGVWNIDNAVVTNAKLAGMAGLTLKGNATGSSATAQDLTATQVRTLLNVADGANAYAHPNHSGDVTSVGDGAQTIVNGAVTFAKMQNITGPALAGRETGTSGVMTTITVGGGIEFNTGALRTTAFTGDVTKAAGGTALTIANDAVTNAKAANMAQDTIKGRATTGTGDPEDLTATQVRTILNVANGANNYIHPNHTGDVTSTGDGAQVIANAAVTFAKMQNITGPGLAGRETASSGVMTTITVGGGIEFSGGALRTTAFTGDVTKVAGGTALTIAAGVVTNAKLATMPTMTMKGNNTGSTAAPVDMTVANVVSFVASGSGGGTTNFLRADGTWAVPPGSGGGISDGDKGDITVASGATVWTIDAGVVTNAKMAAMAQSTIKGRAEGAGSGDPTDLSATQIVAIIDELVPTLGGVNTYTAINVFAANPQILSTSSGTSGPVLDIIHNSPDPAQGDSVGYIQFWGNDNAANLTIYGVQRAVIDDTVNGSEDSYLIGEAQTAGALTIRYALGILATPEAAFTAGVGAIATRRDGGVGTTAYVKENGVGNTGWAAVNTGPIPLIIAVGDETTALATGTAKVTFRAPFAMTVEGVRASLTTASSSGNPTVDINEAGVSILGANKLSIDSGEKTSTTATTATSIADAAIADDAEITIDIDTAGTGAKGLKVLMLIRKTG